MPALYSIKQYVENGIYHVFNRGSDKRKIFLEPSDYSTFMNILKQMLLPKTLIIEELIAKKLSLDSIINRGNAKSYFGRIKLHEFVLMPNHFHLLISQKEKGEISRFMKSAQVRYSMYFNHKYERVGSLYQSRYRGILIKDRNQLLAVSRYIHRNPLKFLENGAMLRSYSKSSYSTYLRITGGLKWVDTKLILDLFNSEDSDLARQKYLRFVEDN